jgi:hypothetical protein
MSKISQYTAISNVESNDLLVVVDVNDLTEAPSGTTKNMSLSQLAAVSLPLPTGVPSPGQVPVATGTGEASAWTTPTPSSGRYLAAPNQYAPAGQTIISVNSTTLAAWSSANITTPSFTAPSSGSVVVTLSCQALAATAGHNIMLGLAAHGTITPVVCPTITVQVLVASVLQPMMVQFLVSSLTPGSTYQFDLLGAVTSGDTASIYAFGPTALTIGSKGSPVLMSVQAV